MAATQPLSDEDLASARTELAAGRPFPVWFTPAAVGVPAGGSAKVVSVGEAGEGDFIEVRPTGSRDTVFCAPNELTRTRPPRRRKGADAVDAEEKAPRGRRASDTGVTPGGAGSAPAAAGAAAATGGAAQMAPAQMAPAQMAPAPKGASSGPAPGVDPSARAGADPGSAGRGAPGRVAVGAPGPAAGRSTSRPRAGAAEVTVTLTSSPDGEWTVEVSTGRKRTVRPTPVQPAEVAKAARALPDVVAEAIESSLEAARQRQAERVERLQAELDAAQRALRELNG